MGDILCDNSRGKEGETPGEMFPARPPARLRRSQNRQPPPEATWAARPGSGLAIASWTRP